MVLPPQEVLSMADWERIQSLLNQPKAKVYTRQEVVERNALLQFSRAENKLNKVGQRKLHAAKKLERQAKEEYMNKVAAEEAELKKQERQQAVDRANILMFHQNGCVTKFNRVIQTTHVQKENEALIKFNQEKQRSVKEQKRQSEEEMRYGQGEALRQEQQKALQKQLYNQEVAVYQTEQMKEKQQLREQEMQQEKEERERLRHLDELHAQELRSQAQKLVESKKNYLEYRLEDISSRKLHREMETQKLNMVEEERKQVQSDLGKKLRQRKNEQAEKFRMRQIPIEIATHRLAARMKEQAAATAQKEEMKFSKEVAKQDAEVAKQQKEKEEKRAAMIKSIAAHREVKMEEKKEKEKAEQKSNLDWFQAQRQSDKVFVEQQKRKAQRNRESKCKNRDSNDTMIAEKRASAEQLKRQEHDAAVKSAAQAAEREKQLQQYIQSELHRAAESQRNVPLLLAASTGGHGFLVDGEEPGYFCINTGNPMPRLATDQTRFMKQNLERNSLQLSMVDMELSSLPPLFRAVKLNFAAKTLVRGRTETSSYLAKGSEESLPRLGASHTRSTKQHQERNKLQPAGQLHLTHLPPISNRLS